MSEFVPIICFILGLATGAGIVFVGFKLGFKASYEIRNQKEESAEGKGLFKGEKEPAEFELLKEDEEANKKTAEI